MEIKHKKYMVGMPPTEGVLEPKNPFDTFDYYGQRSRRARLAVDFSTGYA
jgi:hypothetical protein